MLEVIAIGSMIHLAAFSSLWAGEVSEEHRPNIIRMISEDMGPDLGCWGASVHTPNIDRLAADGMRFTRVFGTASVCMPNRTAMITGVTQTTLGSVTMRPPKQFMRPLPGEVKPLPTVMREYGYHTGNIRDSEIGSTGKDDWNVRFEGKGWDTTEFSDLKAHQPFFAQFNFAMAHRPFRQDDARPIDPKNVVLPPYYPDHPVTRQAWSDYIESIQHLDRNVGRVTAWLEREGLADNTIVFFLSDNGEAFLRGKYFLYDCSLNQPLIIHWPTGCSPPGDFERGSTSDRLSERTCGIDRRTSEMMMQDLAAARALWIDEAANDKEHQDREKSDFLKYRDSSGRFADFHSLRHTFVTNLCRADISPKTAQTLARHSDIRLTMNVYSHVEEKERADAIQKLPGLDGGEEKRKAG